MYIPLNPTKASSDSVLIQFPLPIEMPPMLKIKPIIATAKDAQKAICTHDV